jgi:hypothetical protein
MGSVVGMGAGWSGRCGVVGGRVDWDAGRWRETLEEKRWRMLMVGKGERDMRRGWRLGKGRPRRAGWFGETSGSVIFVGRSAFVGRLEMEMGVRV